ncbi:MAG: (Na+)-NQR maturation NqrM [Pseudomonadota bacterium]
METFALAFIILMLAVLGMSLGVIISGRTIKGSCGGLNALSDADQCLVCNKEIDPNSPLKDRLNCPRLKNARSKLSDMAMSDATASRH